MYYLVGPADLAVLDVLILVDQYRLDLLYHREDLDSLAILLWKIIRLKSNFFS